jgi:hypothetical protein
MWSVLATRDIAVYGAVVATISAAWSIAWTIYSGVLRDRARVKLAVYDAEAWDPGFDHALDAISFAVYNRGRRTIHVSDLVRVSSVLRGTRELSFELQRQVKANPTIEEGRGRSFHLGGDGNYTHGDLSLKRWHVVDESGRVYPLRERSRQRAECVVFWPSRKVLGWWDARQRGTGEPG